MCWLPEVWESLFSPEIRRVRKLILYLGLLIYAVVRTIQGNHDLLGYSVYGVAIFLLLLELLDIFKEMTRTHKGS